MGQRRGKMGEGAQSEEGIGDQSGRKGGKHRTKVKAVSGVHGIYDFRELKA